MKLARLVVGAVAAACSAGAVLAANPLDIATNTAAVGQLIEAVSLDAMSEATLGACEDLGVASAAQMREAWVAWRERHQIAPLRMVVARMQQDSSSMPQFSRLTEPMRQRVLSDPSPEQACANLARDWQSPAMDVTTQYPQARAVAQALVKGKMVSMPTPLPIAPEAARGQLLLPSQIPALSAQRGHWLVISEEAAQQRLGPIYVKGRVARNTGRAISFMLVQEQGDRHVPQRVYVGFDAEPWMGREIVLRGLATSLDSDSISLADAVLVTNPAGLTPSPLPQAPMQRKEVLLQRVQTAPGRGLAEKDLAAVVVHGEANLINGTNWDDDVRFLLRDGTVYLRTEMPPDQLNVAASRQLEPQQWGKWRSAGKGYEMQAQDDTGRPQGDWKPEKHHAAKPWPKDTRLDGYFTRSSFHGSVILGGRSSTRSIRFTKDGRFERSFSALSSTGTLQAINGTVIAGSAYGDGKGSSRTGGGTVGTGLGTVGVSSGTRKEDDGASRRGRYQLNGYVATLDYDDGHQERLLCFPIDDRSVYLGDGSYDLDKPQ